MNFTINTGTSVTIIGMGIVFAVLIILWLVLEVMRLVFDPNSKSQKKTENLAEPSSLEQAKPQGEDNDELIAVISAAVAMVLNKPSAEFKITSIKRFTDTTPEWGRAGRKSFLNNIFC